MHARRLAKLIVRLGLATEARVTLHWFPGDREARVLDIATPGESVLVGDKIAHLVDLTLKHSGEHFPVPDLVEIARWGHFGMGHLPWEVLGRL
jgi:S-adenosylmethionine synthetase